MNKIGFSIANEENKNESTQAFAPVEGLEAPVRSVVTVHFVNGKEYPYYNDSFNLKVGDTVFVDGKLAGIQGEVVKVSTQFKVSLDYYKRVIAKLNFEFHGKFNKVNNYMLCENPNALTPEQVKPWFFPPREAEEEFFVGEGYTVELKNADSIELYDEDAIDDAYDVIYSANIKYISVNNGKGFAIVKGSKPHTVEFTYADGVVTDLLCDCIEPYMCGHALAVCIALKAILDELPENSKPNFTALHVSEFIKLIVQKDSFNVTL